MNANRIFWGLMLIVIGGFWVLGNFGILPENFWYEMWRLWPLLLVFWGVSLFFGKNEKIHVFLSVIMVIIVAATMVLFGWIFNNGKTSSGVNSNISEELNVEANRGELNLKFGAASLNVFGSSSLFVEGSAQTVTGLDVQSNLQGDIQKVNVEQISNMPVVWGIHNSKNEINLKITEKIPLELNLDTGASKFDLDLSQIKISDLTINCGASDGKIQLGSTLDYVKIGISSGASNFKLKLPRDYALKIVNKSGLSGNNFQGLGLQRDGENWKSEGYSSATKKIDLTFSSGVSNIEIEKY